MRHLVTQGLWALLATATAAAQQAPVATPAPTTLALVETYANGQTHYELVSPKPAKSWTPSFPRISGWRSADPEALPITALQIGRVLTGTDVRVDVSLLLGSPHRSQIDVATVVLRRGDRVRVEELRAFGVEPIDLSLADVAPLVPYVPTVYSRVPDFEIATVDVLTVPYPGYRVTVRNVSSKAVANFHVQSYRGVDKAISFLPRGEQGRPVLTPGGTHTFDLNVVSGNGTDAPGWTPRPLDVIEIDWALWDDGTYTGQPDYRSDAIATDAGRRLQLLNVLEKLRSVATPGAAIGLPALRARLEAMAPIDPTRLPDAQRAMRFVKVTVLEDLRRFEEDRTQSHDADSTRQWLAMMIRRYEQWVSRLSSP